MINIVIAAGYATRLRELTKNFPKPLLKIGESTILSRMLDDIDAIPEITEHVIVTNHKFDKFFEEDPLLSPCLAGSPDRRWKKPITILDDGTSTNETRLGAVNDLLLAIDYIDKKSSLNREDLGGSGGLSI